MNTFKHIIRILFGVIVLLWLLLFMVPKIPAVQGYLGKEVSAALEEKLGTKVVIGNVDVRLPDRIIIDDVLVYDQSNKVMLRAGHIAVVIDVMPLLDGKVRISSAQLFSTHASLYQKNAHSPLNCQFVIDSLKSKDTTSRTPLDLAITSLVIRHSSVDYDRLDAPVRHHRFSPYHLKITNLSSDITLSTLTDDTLDVDIKNLYAKEHSGLTIKRLSAIVQASKNIAYVRNLSLELPNTKLNIAGQYTSKGQVRVKGYVTPSDLTSLEPRLSSFDKPLDIDVKAEGDADILHVALTAALKDKSFQIDASGVALDLKDSPHGHVNIKSAHLSQKFINSMSALGITIPQQVDNLGDINLLGQVAVKDKTSFNCDATIAMSNAGKTVVQATYRNNSLEAHIQTSGLALGTITGEKKLGNIACDVTIKTPDISNLTKNVTARGTVSEISYNNYTYHNISLDASLHGKTLSGTLSVNDPNLTLDAKGSGNIATQVIDMADVRLTNFSPSKLNITDILGDVPLNAEIHITSDKVTLSSDIVDITMDGKVNIQTIPYSIANIVRSQIPSAPALPKPVVTHNNFTINMEFKDIALLSRILKADISAPDGIHLNGYVNDNTHTADLTLDAPDMTINDRHLLNTKAHFYTPDDAVRALLTTSLKPTDMSPVDLAFDFKAKDNSLHTIFSWDNRSDRTFKGSVFSDTQFHTALDGTSSISLVIPHSEFQVDDSIWSIQANRILYDRGAVHIDNFLVGNSDQKIYLNGKLSSNQQDSLSLDLSNVNVRYILNLINFHAVDFDGNANGHFVGKNLLGDIMAHGHLDVRDFQFEHGNMGDLHADAVYDSKNKHINIDAIADDPKASARTLINGYIATAGPEGLDLDIKAENTELQFMQSFCSSFMKEASLNGTGHVRLFGPFNNINLDGTLVADGAFTLSATNCRYTMKGDTVSFVPDDIRFRHFVLYDKLGNDVHVNGSIHHKHLTRMSYDIKATTDRLLAYDFPTIGGNDTFCGYALIKGDINIKGHGNELIISADATPLKDTYFTYDASSPDAIRGGEIITWRSATALRQGALAADGITIDAPAAGNITDWNGLNSGNNRTNIYFNFVLHTNADSRLHLIMDQMTGDYVNLFGSGDLRVEYYNKGALNIFGNYEVDHGTYKMTIQNILRRDFSFRKGGMITFGGDPYDALINMNAVYKLASVPLSDLNIGSNFARTNVPVNCLMNITGTPGSPRVAFDVELPSLSSDARQMVNSVINSEEEMNQQVLYLLAIGRFYAPSSSALASSSSSTSASTTQEVSQSSLAIQSFLSGTLSQSFNNMMSGVMGRLNRSGNNLSFGANIAPGNQGLTNAEYEGLLSGNFFNNRLLFSGQFGYRDHVATNTSSFIGDFSLQYILTKNGIISLKVYNQSNDRYFTRNTLNTQGIGIVIQKEWGK